MKIFKGKNFNTALSKPEFRILNGGEYLFRSVYSQGVKNIFIETHLVSLFPELPNLTFLKFYSNPELFWTSIYALSSSNQRVIGLVKDQFFLNFQYLEKYFVSNNVNGGTVLFMLKENGIKNFSSNLHNILPVYNYFKLDDFINLLPFYFELSEKLGLPVLIYVNKSVFYEYRSDESLKSAERTEIKPVFNVKPAEPKVTPTDIKMSFNVFKNTGKLFDFFSGETHKNLIFSDAANFHRIAENHELMQCSDVILFNLLNPFFGDKFTDILKNNCKEYYENIFIYDDYSFLRIKLNETIKNYNLNLRFGALKFFESGGSDNGFCLDNFIAQEVASDPSFCVGCNLHFFFQKLKDLKNLENVVFIGDKDCFSFLKTSGLKYSFPNYIETENPLYYIDNLNLTDFNKKFFVFVSSLTLLDQLNIALAKVKGTTNLTLVIYRSIYDFKNNFSHIVNSPLFNSVGKIVLKSNARLTDFKTNYTVPLICIDNSCTSNAKTGKNLNYSKFLFIKTDICGKHECKLCFQLTRCPAIRVDKESKILIDPASCNICNLCVEICPHNAITTNKKKFKKIQKSIESKINLN